ncbi:MAG: hypothetical protein ACLGG7_01350 [Bacteriovoracia bacterium]
MKIAFAIDFLVERDTDVFLLELLLAGFPDADIYCLAHAQGKILGRIETHRIHSSPLSRLVQSRAELRQRSWMLPSMVKQLRVSPDVDKLIIISSGWAHLIATASKTERFVWCHQLSPRDLKLSGWKRIFSFYHEDLKERSLLKELQVTVASQQLNQQLERNFRVIYPGIKTDDYVLIPDEQHTGEYPHHLVLLAGADVNRVRQVFALAREAKVPVKCVGRDEAFAAEKALNDPNLEFIGDHCAATTAAFTHGARAVWCLSEDVFPAQALGALACGRPAVVLDRPHNREILPAEGTWFAGEDLGAVFQAANRDYLSADKKQLRRAGLKFNERLFKNQIRAWAGVKPPKDED